MIRYETHFLLALRAEFERLADLAVASVGMDRDQALDELHRYAMRGTYAFLVKDDDVLIGYLIFGPAEKFISYVEEFNLERTLRNEGVAAPWTICHLHVAPERDGQGVVNAMSINYCREIVRLGGTHLLIWGAATEQLAQYALRKAGGRPFNNGMTDSAGRSAGVRDLSVFLRGAG